MAVTSRPKLKKTSLNFSNFAGRGSGGVVKNNQFANIGQTAGNNVKMLDSIIAVEDDVDELDIRVTNIAATTRVLGAQNRSFQESIANIRERVGALESGQQAILDFQKDKEKIEERKRKLEEARLKREGAEKSLEDDATKKDIEEKDPKTKKAATGAMGILDRLKRFFTFVVAGWFTDKTFKLIEAFQTGNKSMITKIGLKLLAGTAAVAGIMSMAVFGIGPVLLGIGKLIALVAGLLFNPVTLTALLIAVGVGGAILGIKKLWDWGTTKQAGGKKFKQAHKDNEAKLNEAGVKRHGKFNMDTNILGQWRVQRDGEWTKLKYENLTDAERAAIDSYKEERQRLRDLKNAMNKEKKQVEKDQPMTGVSSGSLGVPEHSKADWKIIRAKQAKIQEKYDAMIKNETGSTVGGGSNVSSVQYNESTGKYELPETDEGKVNVVTNPVEETTVQKGKKKGVEPLESGNDDNYHTLNTQVQLGVVA